MLLETVQNPWEAEKELSLEGTLTARCSALASGAWQSSAAFHGIPLASLNRFCGFFRTLTVTGQPLRELKLSVLKLLLLFSRRNANTTYSLDESALISMKRLKILGLEPTSGGRDTGSDGQQPSARWQPPSCFVELTSPVCRSAFIYSFCSSLGL